MATRNLVVRLIVLFFFSFGFIYAQPFEVIEIGTGAHPRWSPDGKKSLHL